MNPLFSIIYSSSDVAGETSWCNSGCLTYHYNCKAYNLAPSTEPTGLVLSSSGGRPVIGRRMPPPCPCSSRRPPLRAVPTFLSSVESLRPPRRERNTPEHRAGGIPLHLWLLRVGFSTLWNTALPIVTYTRSAFTGNLSQFVSSLVVFILTFIVPQTCLWCLWSCSYKGFSLVLLKLLAVSSAFRRLCFL